jgi:hypothetical protein
VTKPSFDRQFAADNSCRGGRQCKWGRRSEPLGFTLLEVSIYATLLILLGTPLISVILVSTRSTVENDTINRVNERNRAVLVRIETDVRESIKGSPVVADFGKSLTVTSVTGFDGTSPIPGPALRYTFQAAPGESLNGVDDNGNGLADEGQVIYTNMTTGETIIISSGVDVFGSSFALSGNSVNINLTSFGTIPPRNDVFGVTRSVLASPRN